MVGVTGSIFGRRGIVWIGAMSFGVNVDFSIAATAADTNARQKAREEYGSTELAEVRPCHLNQL